MDAPLPDLPPPPSTGIWVTLEPALRRGYALLNRWFMVPVHRLGLGAWIATPIGGYMLLLRVRGRRTGKDRYVPLSYVIVDGAIWVLAGYGTRTEWYRNILVDPEVDAWLPGRVVRCRASEARQPADRTRIIPFLARNIGLPGAMIGASPWHADDRTILETVSWVPLIRLDPLSGPIAGGPDDPGGHAWIWRQLAVAGLALCAVRAARRRARR